MASSSGSKPDTPLWSSPFLPVSTPRAGTESDGKRPWTPDTTPSCVSHSQGAFEFNLQNAKKISEDARPSNIWRTHMERQRLAEMARLGLDQTPSKVAGEGEHAVGPGMTEFVNKGVVPPFEKVRLYGPDRPAAKARPRLWTMAANRWPFAFENNGELGMTGETNSRTQLPGLAGPGPASCGFVENSKLREPSPAATWTFPTLSPIPPFSTPAFHQLPIQNPQQGPSLWSFPNDTDALRVANKGKNNSFSKLNSINPDSTGQPTGDAGRPQRIVSMNVAAHPPQPLGLNQPRMEYPLVPSASGIAATFPWVPRVGTIRNNPAQRGYQIPNSNVPAVPVGQPYPWLINQPGPEPSPRGIPTLKGLDGTHNEINTTNDPGSAANVMNHGQSSLSFYHPMTCRSSTNRRTQQQTQALLLKGFSANYRGDPDVMRNQSAAIAEEESCSLWIVGLAPDLDTHELLAGIRNIGRVYATHINPPAPERGHVLSAAKVVFFERAAAELFHTTFAPTGYWTPRNPQLRARVSWNRIRSAETDVGGNRSRVLLVSGPPQVVNEEYLCAYFNTKFEYQFDQVIYCGANAAGNRVLLELRFGSFRCQAESARTALMREFKDAGIVCEFGWDPCGRVQEVV